MVGTKTEQVYTLTSSDGSDGTAQWVFTVDGSEWVRVECAAHPHRDEGDSVVLVCHSRFTWEFLEALTPVEGEVALLNAKVFWRTYPWARPFTRDVHDGVYAGFSVQWAPPDYRIEVDIRDARRLWAVLARG